MVILLPLILIFLPFTWHIDTPHYLQLISEPFHQWCVHRIPPSSFSPLYRALSCGASIKKGSPFWEIFRTLGLLHLLVVSGYHLVILEKILCFILKRCGLTITHSSLLLLPFVFMCRFQPPVVRSFLQMSIRPLGHSYHWNQSTLTWFSGGICLILFPPWLNSLSFQMSWAAALLLCFPLHGWRKALLFYFGLLPFTFQMGMAHPLSIICEFLLSPFLACTLLIIALIILIVPNTEPHFKPITHFLIELIDQISKWMPAPFSPHFIFIQKWAWIWIFFLFGIAYLCEIILCRRSH